MAGKSFLEMFRRSSSAYNVMEGSLLTGKVLRIQRSGFVSVDVGFRSPQTFPIAELGSKQIAAGDTHNFFLENVETPLGDMELDAKRTELEHKDESIWNEIAAAYRINGAIKGRILNAVNAGYAVGIGGLVAFLPSSRVYREMRVGELLDFKILSTIEDTRNVVLTAVDRADIDSVLRSRVRLAESAAASETLLQRYSAARSVPRGQTKPRLAQEADTSALLARVRAMRERKEAEESQEGAAAPAPLVPTPPVRVAAKAAAMERLSFARAPPPAPPAAQEPQQRAGEPGGRPARVFRSSKWSEMVADQKEPAGSAAGGAAADGEAGSTGGRPPGGRGGGGGGQGSAAGAAAGGAAPPPPPHVATSSS